MKKVIVAIHIDSGGLTFQKLLEKRGFLCKYSDPQYMIKCENDCAKFAPDYDALILNPASYAATGSFKRLASFLKNIKKANPNIKIIAKSTVDGWLFEWPEDSDKKLFDAWFDLGDAPEVISALHELLA